MHLHRGGQGLAVGQSSLILLAHPPPSLLKHLPKVEGVQQYDRLADGTAGGAVGPRVHRLTNASDDLNYRQILVEFLEPAALAVDETAILLHPPLPSVRCFNVDGERVSAK